MLFFFPFWASQKFEGNFRRSKTQKKELFQEQKNETKRTIKMIFAFLQDFRIKRVFATRPFLDRNRASCEHGFSPQIFESDKNAFRTSFSLFF
jgi:hypothetical protein